MNNLPAGVLTFTFAIGGHTAMSGEGLPHA